MTDNSSDTGRLVERLREQAQMKSSEAWRRQDGGQDLCIGASLAEEAADALEAKDRAIVRLTACLSTIRKETVEECAKVADQYDMEAQPVDHFARTIAKQIRSLSTGLASGKGENCVGLSEAKQPAPRSSMEGDKLKALLREMSDALLTLRPLGGSEMLKRVYIDGQEEYYADAHYCTRLIEQMRADCRKAKTPDRASSIEATTQDAHGVEPEHVEAVKPSPANKDTGQ